MENLSQKIVLQYEVGSTMDPTSSHFRPRAWIRALLDAQDPNQYKPRTAGFSFRNLNAYGFGTATDYQKTVGNIWLYFAGVLRSTLGGAKTRIDILRDLEGLVNHSEMLMVLGPPGR